MKKYTHLFFDLDHTLWDFERNSRETLLELYDDYDFEQHGFDKTVFVSTYEEINYDLWRAYQRLEIDQKTLREVRFKKVFNQLKIAEEKVPDDIDARYLYTCPTKQHTIPHSLELLERVHKEYKVIIVTNGFIDVQEIKMRSSGIEKYVHGVITSEAAGALKPAPAIFDYALRQSSAKKKESLMIGDNLETDIQGALNFGIDQVYFNRDNLGNKGACTYEICCMSELNKLV